jgi:hypothetical protein
MNPTTETIAEQGAGSGDNEARGAGTDFVYDVEGTTYHNDTPTITGAEIMTAAGIPAGDGLVQLLPDGTTTTVKPNDEVQLVPGAQFKRRPRFKRG